MKKTDLYKNLGLKINDQRKKNATPKRFGKNSAADDADKAGNEKRLHPIFATVLKKD